MYTCLSALQFVSLVLLRESTPFEELVAVEAIVVHIVQVLLEHHFGVQRGFQFQGFAAVLDWSL